MTSDEDKAKVDAMLAKIRPHVEALRLEFDTVQIMCTKVKSNEDLAHPTDEGTYQFSLGAGNWYARYGHLSIWVERERQDAERGSDS